MSLMAKLTQTWTQDIDGLEDAIVSNLCSLIAARAPIWSNVERENSLCRDSIVHFGLYDTLVRSSNRSTENNTIVDELGEQLSYFEPRLRQLQLNLTAEKLNQNPLPFRISGVMYSGSEDESMVLDSLLDFSRHKLVVRKSNLV